MNFWKKYNQHGFTIHEMLLVILISLIFLALSVVGIVTYMRYLRLAQLDNSAKEIFLAAQNRAILLRSNQQLDEFVVGDANSIKNVDVIPGSNGGIQITVYYIHCNSSHMDQLLPSGTIDPTLWDGDFWITYEPESGSVIDVFFSEQDLEVGDDFADFYKEWRAASKSDRMDRKPMVGYYGGESAESGTTISLRTPVINIYNEDTLRVEVTYWVPRTLYTMGEDGNVKLDVALTYQSWPAQLKQTEAQGFIETEGTSYFTYTYTWTLDSLKEEERQFREISFQGASGLSYGDDFTVSAEVSYTGTALKVNGARKSASDNSLFAKDSGGDTAYIACLRHLQNLDTDWSKVSGEKTKAVQQGDIQGVEGYEFLPIENVALNSYDGGEFSIYALKIDGSGACAGMFGNFSGGASARKTLENIRLVNTVLQGSRGPAGALVGDGSYLTIDNCQVYWENRSEETTNLRDVLGDSTKGIKYQITGSGPAGGLAGMLTNSAITGCSASSLVQSTDPVGGLVGCGSVLEIDRSYAASYLDGPACGGLVGDLTGRADLYGSYAVGFINSGTVPAKAAGLCLGGGAATVTSSYSAMLFTAAKTADNYPLCENGAYTLTHFLDSDHFDFQQNTDLGVSYSTLIDSEQWRELFGSGVFASKSIVQSHPYNLQTTLSLNTYIYPGLGSLDHWGDWGAQFQDGSLVYYEVYADGSYGFNISGLSHLFDDKTVVADGYAVAYKSTEPISGIGATLEVTYQSGDDRTTEEFDYGGQGEHPIYVVYDVTNTEKETYDYYLLPLPGEVVNSGYAAKNFYQEITIQDTPDQAVTAAGEKTYYYSPHFANTVLSADEVKEEELPSKAKRLQVEVRTPRHLYNLSQFENYYSSGNEYRFLQQLDLNYDTYTGYDLFPNGWAQTPIGPDAARPFGCVYFGNCHSITGVVPAVGDEAGSAYQHVGLFGYSIGVLQDIVYQMKGADVLSVTQSGSSSETLYVGGLAGYNGGTVENCAAYGVQMQANGYQYSTIYLGGLVGENQGTIQSSAVEGASIHSEASMSHTYAGGFVGENTAGGIIDQCYAVGKVSVTQARYGTVYACGFAGRSSATLSRSYAAVYLLADGEAQRYGFCPDSSTSCVYLNNGNFTYRDENYAALYEDIYATPVTWAALAGQSLEDTSEEAQQQAAAVEALGMRWGATSTWMGEYPYPAVVTKKEDTSLRYIHYGQWPEQMELGTMGVYYWEKLTIGQSSNYYISAISMATGQQVMKSGTLSTAHGDGGVVTEYGYGYFTQVQTQEESMDVTVTSESIGYHDDSGFTPSENLENTGANDALSALMGGQYVFHSYNTWQAAENKGLYVIWAGQANGSQPPYGTWTLTQGAYSLEVRLNPFFADAMSYDEASQLRNISAPTALPGTQANPYGVRSIDQLQFINWNHSTRNTKTVLTQGKNDQFPYLCYKTSWSTVTRPFYWEQSHDLTGNKGVYTPIAEFYDTTNAATGFLYGWFGGTYDGQDYLIANVNIQGQKSSCAGLFGVVFNGMLRNVVLYSEDGNGFVNSYNSKTDSSWYAIGGLAGLAATSSAQRSAIENCAVAGYTITDSHTGGGSWGGTGLGGLVGISNMNLSGCSAVTHIVLSSHDNDNVRVGGLVGTSQGSISNSYTGGSIQVEKAVVNRERGIYIGGICGGIYMKPLTVDNSTTIGKNGSLQNEIKNCYTYVELPAQDSMKTQLNTNGWYGQHYYGGGIMALYAIGGNGDLHQYYQNDSHVQHPNDAGPATGDRGQSMCSNNYYLEAVVMRNNPDGITIRDGNNLPIAETDIYGNDYGNAVATSMTYGEMKDTEGEDGLLAKLKNAGFSTVTTTSSGGNPLNGRYSFGCDQSLLGQDYPFPTILTQVSDLVVTGKANVHYGDWPLAGIRRQYGGLPVNLDLFADYEENKGAVHTESLSLEGVEPGGKWEWESADEKIAAAALSGEESDHKTLSITGLKEGSTVVTVTYTVGSELYTLNIEVNVTAQLRLAATAPTPVLAFTGQTVQTALELRDHDGKTLPNPLKDLIELSNPTVKFDSDYFVSASIGQQGGVSLTADSDTKDGNTQMTVGYDFTYLGNNYRATSSIPWNLVTPEIKVKPLVIIFQADASQAQQQTVFYTGEGSEEFILNVNGTAASIEKLRIVEFQVDDDHTGTIWVDWAKDEDGTVYNDTLSIEAYCPEQGTAYASVRVRFQYEYAGSIHTVWTELEVQIKKEAAQGGGEGAQEGQL